MHCWDFIVKLLPNTITQGMEMFTTTESLLLFYTMTTFMLWYSHIVKEYWQILISPLLSRVVCRIILSGICLFFCLSVCLSLCLVVRLYYQSQCTACQICVPWTLHFYVPSLKGQPGASNNWIVCPYFCPAYYPRATRCGGDIVMLLWFPLCVHVSVTLLPCEHNRNLTIVCLFIKLGKHVHYDERMNPFDLGGQRSRSELKFIEISLWTR